MTTTTAPRYNAALLAQVAHSTADTGEGDLQERAFDAELASVNRTRRWHDLPEFSRAEFAAHKRADRIRATSHDMARRPRTPAS